MTPESQSDDLWRDQTGASGAPTPEAISAGLDQAEAFANDPANHEAPVNFEPSTPEAAAERNIVGGIRGRLETAAARLHLDKITSAHVEGALKATMVALPAFGPEALAFEPFIAAALAGVSHYNDRKPSADHSAANLN
jgi:hypothetical protein